MFCFCIDVRSKLLLLNVLKSRLDCVLRSLLIIGILFFTSKYIRR